MRIIQLFYHGDNMTSNLTAHQGVFSLTCIYICMLNTLYMFCLFVGMIRTLCMTAEWIMEILPQHLDRILMHLWIKTGKKISWRPVSTKECWSLCTDWKSVWPCSSVSCTWLLPSVYTLEKIKEIHWKTQPGDTSHNIYYRQHSPGSKLH